jgi:hypothetical protein
MLRHIDANVIRISWYDGTSFVLSVIRINASLIFISFGTDVFNI